MIMVVRTADSYRFLDAIQKRSLELAPGQRSTLLESKALSHHPWSVYPGARQTLEVILADRLHLSWR